MNYKFAALLLFTHIVAQNPVPNFDTKNSSNKNLVIPKKNLLDAAIPVRDLQKIILAYLFTWQNSLGILEFEPSFQDDIISSMAFSPDGKYLISRSSTDPFWENINRQERSTIALWNIKTLIKEKIIKNTTGKKVVISPDGKFFASAKAVLKIKLFDCTTCEPLSEIPMVDAEIRALVFSPNGKYIVAAETNNSPLTIYDVKTGLSIKQFKKQKSYAGSQIMAFTQNGKKIFTASSSGEGIIYWDTETCKKGSIYVNDPSINQLEITHDDKYLVCLTRNDDLLFYDIEKAYWVQKYHAKNISHFSISNNGKYLFFVTCDVENDKKQYKIHILDLLSFKEIEAFTHGISNDVAFSPNGIYIAQAMQDSTIEKFSNQGLTIEILSNQALEIENADLEEDQNNQKKNPTKSDSGCVIL